MTSHLHNTQAVQETAEERVSRILSENIVSISEARVELQKLTNKRHDKATICRWIHKGVGGVRLDGIKLGNALYTSLEALNRFAIARTEQITK